MAPVYKFLIRFFDVAQLWRAGLLFGTFLSRLQVLFMLKLCEVGCVLPATGVAAGQYVEQKVISYLRRLKFETYSFPLSGFQYLPRGDNLPNGVMFH